MIPAKTKRLQFGSTFVHTTSINKVIIVLSITLPTSGICSSPSQDDVWHKAFLNITKPIGITWIYVAGTPTYSFTKPSYPVQIKTHFLSPTTWS